MVTVLPTEDTGNINYSISNKIGKARKANLQHSTAKMFIDLSISSIRKMKNKSEDSSYVTAELCIFNIYLALTVG